MFCETIRSLIVDDPATEFGATELVDGAGGCVALVVLAWVGDTLGAVRAASPSSSEEHAAGTTIASMSTPSGLRRRVIADRIAPAVLE
jgi:hypothetical protein